MASQLEKIRKKILSGEISKPKDPHQKSAGGFEDTIIYPEFSDKIPDKLEEVENQIKKLKNKVSECGWLIGKRLISIESKHLEGTPYQNITEYAESKFGFKRTTTYNLLFVSKNFTKVQSIELSSKLYLLYSLEENKRQKYLDWMMREKPSRKEIEDKIKSEIKKPGRPKEEFSLTKTAVKIDLREMGYQISKDKKQAFFSELKSLVKKYADTLGEETKMNV